MSKLVTIYGGSGFLGRQITRIMAANGWRVRVAVRRPDEALFLKTAGAVGQVVPVLCNIRDDLSVRAAMAGADAVINCVGLLVREGKNTFDGAHVQGAGRVARIAAETGVAQMVHVSAIGADAESISNYARTKAEGEAEVLKHRPDAVILRPSVMFGQGDSFLNKFAALSRLGPVMAITGGKTRLQPVWVEDVAQAAAKAAEGQAAAGIYELGGPDVLTLRDVVGQVLKTVDRRRLVINLPFAMGEFVGFGFDAVQFLTGGLVTNRMLTVDQVRSLRTDNVVADSGVKTFADLDITPSSTALILPEYLWRFRPSGQYETIKASAKNLRHPQ
ncbi:MAG: complex I NDUFA9 subunit family protein [Paracoccus sp. (in: a-proteobacteria)]|uniref:complex I NDUFA9 subunit family protein n=1 Tax=Paracoccus sp. TaxID=267 RepID=UPI0026E0AA6F|nr:complex I NDUFA9 subunit family protein [Paracoccus sp. (in: a-proteobacteria)]MDO5621753.1 complex I NDUFA9 subunit family protein [Paracoccus sp. (in: a-proteobacteria)]